MSCDSVSNFARRLRAKHNKSNSQSFQVITQRNRAKQFEGFVNEKQNHSSALHIQRRGKRCRTCGWFLCSCQLTLDSKGWVTK